MQRNFLLLLAGLVLSACAPALPHSGFLPFTTIEKKNDAAYIGQQQYNALDPGLIVIGDREAAIESGVWFSEDARRKLDRVDWRTQMALAVFQGWRATGGYGIEVQAVRWDGERVRPDVSLQEPAGEGYGGVTSPYHLVVVRRPGDLEGLVFELVVGEQVLVVFPAGEAGH